MRYKILLLVIFITIFNAQAQSPLFKAGRNASILVSENENPVVQTATEILQKDFRSVFGSSLSKSTGSGAEIIAGTLGVSDKISRLTDSHVIETNGIKGKWETYMIKAFKEKNKYKLVVIGSDSRGTAYGLLEISRMLGVSPWEWWADATPSKKISFTPPVQTIIRSPTVQYRGIFLNDEDWGLLPWSSKNYEPEGKLKDGIEAASLKEKSVIGPKTYARIFELLLRLRANTIWPAMHEVTVPFYFVDGTKEAADKYGIILGTSHCEPMMRNSASEWDAAGTGRYNYVTNKDAVISYWADRLKELKGSENIFTIGMRGKHDGQMEGVKNNAEYKEQLSQIIPQQQNLIEQYISKDPAKVPQIFVPYKEVLDVYRSGLAVPAHVTLVWPDDNYGYIRHFPDQAEKARPGGNGVYYHLSYWGRPHDYLWLGTADPALELQQMKMAYEKGVQKIWIANVGDIKPIEYQTELFLDMAWNIGAVKDIPSHLRNFLTREFGQQNAQELGRIMQEHYRLALICKPEYLGNSRTYDAAKAMVSDLPWTEGEIRSRMIEYEQLSKSVEKVSAKIGPDRKNAFFELIAYPVEAAAQMNFKMLNGQLARHGKAEWQLSEKAYDSIGVLTQRYNDLVGGKWHGMMDHRPRKLPVFEPLARSTDSSKMLSKAQPLYRWTASDASAKSVKKVAGLGYTGKAALVIKNEPLKFIFTLSNADAIEVDVRLLPTHAINGKNLRFTLSLDGHTSQEVNYETEEQSEEWKNNVLRNQAVRTFKFKCTPTSKHVLMLTALDEGVVLDELLLFKK
ncbi:glycosyl hydrolase 115 family protein [Mucilaginibacter sp. PAMB04274]|uniref:glycosyl hydrolase 115 family protein n=1 Tax=Mucilaginibacter sp. PAMB04274 TaxID=3138568 RepID=UPI0031F643D0